MREIDDEEEEEGEKNELKVVGRIKRQEGNVVN